ncbi:MAG: hypothetical protein JW829_19665 [Pirellulales bacterium]|nr:hypothetical protein [Pirellulales bacterium]
MLDLLLIGDTARPEFQMVHSILLHSARVKQVPDVEAAEALLQSADSLPQLAVIAAAYPGQFPSSQIEALCRIAPLIKIIALLGSWCEGETRTGHPWPADARVWWYHWPMWWERQIAALAAGYPPIWDMPRTATDQDRILAGRDILRGPGGPTIGPGMRSQGELTSPTNTGIGIAIATADHATYVAMTHALTSVGYPSTWWYRPHRFLEPSFAIMAGIWDGGQLDSREQLELNAFQIQIHSVPVVVLLDFPRIETVPKAHAAGAVAVLGKPYSIDDLASAIRACWRASTGHDGRVPL